MMDADRPSDDFPLEPLTWREEEILSLLAERQTDREIAESLTISLETVKWYNKRLYAKLGVANRREAAARAEELGLLESGVGSTAAPAPNLPAQSTPFVGRQRELEDLSELLSNADIRLVTLLAPGGMGKTRLALKAAEQQAPLFSDGVFFVPLTELGSEEHLASAIADSLGLRLQFGGNPKQQVLQYLREREALILLDNFEHALSGARLVSEILRTAPNTRILATTRERLNLSAETIYPVGGMAFPEKGRAGAAQSGHDAVELFLQTAAHLDPRFEWQAGDAESIERICEMVDGMPLGIVLAAAWVRVLSPPEIMGEISRNLDFLSTEARDVPRRQRSIRAVFESSWKRLSDSARASFERLSVFRGGFTLEAARAAAAANLPTLQLLADRGMLQRAASGRYEVHKLLRQFAEEQLQQRGGPDEARQAHGSYYAALLEAQEAELRSKRQAEALDRIEEEIENVQAAWRHAVKRRDGARLAKMLKSLYFFYETRGWYQEGEAAFRQAASSLSSDPQVDEKQAVLGRLLARQGVFTHRLGRYQEAAQVLQASLAILKASGTSDEVAFTLSFMSDLTRSLGGYVESRQLSQQSLALFREIDDPWGIAGELHNLGVAAHHLGELGQARDYYDESLARSKELGDLHGIVTSLIAIGALEQDQGNFGEAQRLYSESLSMSEELHDRYGVAASLINLGRVHYLMGDLKAARQRCLAGLAICRDLGDRWGTAASLINLGDIACGMDRLQESRAYFSEALQTIIELESEPLAVEALVGMAALLAQAGNEEAAFELLVPIQSQPPDDLETRDRANRLRNRLEQGLSQATVDEIRTRSLDRSIEAALAQLAQLM